MAHTVVCDAYMHILLALSACTWPHNPHRGVLATSLPEQQSKVGKVPKIPGYLTSAKVDWAVAWAIAHRTLGQRM